MNMKLNHIKDKHLHTREISSTKSCIYALMIVENFIFLFEGIKTTHPLFEYYLERF
jgi:hypothetical protein